MKQDSSPVYADSATSSCPVCHASGSLKHFATFYQSRLQDSRWMKCIVCNSFNRENLNNLTSVSDYFRCAPYNCRPSQTTSQNISLRLFKRVIELSHKFHPVAIRLLDVGCGTGEFLRLATESGIKETIGTDVIANNRDTIMASGSDFVDYNSLKSDQSNRGLFDVVTCLDVSCYWTNLCEELDHCRQIISRGGLFILRTTNKAWLFELGSRLNHWLPQLGVRFLRRAVNDHFNSVPLSTMLCCLTRSGFKIEYVSIRDAIQRDDTTFGVRLWFYLSDIVYWLTRRQINIAPGVVIVARVS